MRSLKIKTPGREKERKRLKVVKWTRKDLNPWQQCPFKGCATFFNYGKAGEKELHGLFFVLYDFNLHLYLGKANVFV